MDLPCFHKYVQKYTEMFDIDISKAEPSSSDQTSSNKLNFQLYSNDDEENTSFGQTSAIQQNNLFTPDDSEYLPNFGTNNNEKNKDKVNVSQRSAPQ
jgi:hypothetical protein